MSDINKDGFALKFGPVGFCIGFLELRIDEARDAFVSWKRSIHDSVITDQCSGDIASLIHNLEPLTMPPRRALLLGTTSRWVAYLDNGILGTDASGPIGHLSRTLKCRGVIATSIPHTKSEQNKSQKGSYGAVQFELYGPESDNPLGCIRSVGVTFDSGWHFSANGTAQPFEDVSRYHEKRIATRFTEAMLLDYAAALGIDPYNELFYSRNASLVSFGRAGGAPVRECSLNDARAQLNLPPRL